MPSHKDLIIEFYRVGIFEGEPNIRLRLEAAWAQNPNIQDRNYEDGPDYWRIGNIQYLHNRMVGTFLRLRVESGAKKGRMTDETLVDLQLPPGEVLTEFLAFAFLDEFNVMAIQRNRDAGSSHKMEEYLEWFLESEGIYFEPVMNNSAFEKLNAMTFIQNIEIKVAKPENLELAHPNVQVAEMARLSNATNASSISVTLSAERSHESLSDVCADAFNSLRGFLGSRVSKAVIKGRIHHEDVILDLIKDRMKETVRIQLAQAADGTPLPLSVDGAYNAVLQASDTRHGELFTQFGQIAQ